MSMRRDYLFFSSRVLSSFSFSGHHSTVVPTPGPSTQLNRGIFLAILPFFLHTTSQSSVRARAHYIKFGLTQWRIMFCVSLRANTHTACVSILHQTQLFVTRCESRNIAVVSQFATILFTQHSKGYNCLVDPTIDRTASSAWSFFRPQPFRTHFFSAFLSATAEADQWLWEESSRTVGRQWKEGSLQHGVKDN